MSRFFATGSDSESEESSSADEITPKAPGTNFKQAGAPKQPAKSQRAQPAKPQGHGCTRCSTLEDQLKEKSEEIQRLKEELLKSTKQADC